MKIQLRISILLVCLLIALAAIIPSAFAQTPRTSAANAIFSITSNAGMYSNRIATVTLTVDFTEICFKGGAMVQDLHVSGESTLGGNCLPGDTGWIIERAERGSATGWSDARRQCLQQGMRLPEPFEWQVSCDHAATFGLTDMADDDDAEWASNSAFESSLSDAAGVASIVMGKGASVSGCDQAGLGFLGRISGSRNLHSFRCAR